MAGLAATSLRRIDDAAHLEQSIADILMTPVGSRVMRRDYGSRLAEIVDQPMNGETVVDIFLATAEALAEWEPRFRARRVQVERAEAGRFDLVVEGDVAGVTRAVRTALGGGA